MPPTTLFAVPDSSQRSPHVPPKIARKRKRDGSKKDRFGQDGTQDSETTIASPQRQPAEYSAVVTPSERSQRRLAGLPLDVDLPEAPFPHGPIDRKDERTRDISIPNPTLSLHVQHVAAMTAILHRSMMAHDYTRAGRALGLILRNDMGGKPIDIRNEGLWGVGAEILFRKDDIVSGAPDTDIPLAEHISRAGFERTKTFYETLMIQYPPHRTWPGAVNARDFCIAMFGLWIYVTHQECLQLQANTQDEYGEDVRMTSELQVKLWELEQGRKISNAMGTRMQDTSLRDDPELTRLKGMVALWIADLLETCSDFEDDQRIRQEQEDEYENEREQSDNIDRVKLLSNQALDTTKSRVEEAAEFRNLGQTLLKRIEDRHDGSD